MIPLGVLAQRQAATGGGLPVSDTFTRADNATSLGDAETGHPWLVTPSDAAGVSVNRLRWNNYFFLSGSERMVTAVAVVETGEADVTVTANSGEGPTGTFAFVVARYEDESNYYRLQHQNDPSSRGYVVRVTGGVVDVIATDVDWCPPNASHEHSLTVREEGGATRIIARTGGVQRYSGLDSTSGRPMGTKHGVRAETGAETAWPLDAYVDGFTVTDPAY